MKDYLLVRERKQDANIRFSFCARTIFKKKLGNFVIGMRFKIWDKPQCQTDTSSCVLDQETCWSLSHPYQSLLDSHLCVHNDRCQRSWDTGAGGHNCTHLEKNTEALPGTAGHTAKLKKGGKEKNWNKSFHAQVPTTLSLLTQHQTPRLHPATSFSLWGFRHHDFKHLAC